MSTDNLDLHHKMDEAAMARFKEAVTAELEKRGIDVRGKTSAELAKMRKHLTRGRAPK